MMADGSFEALGMADAKASSTKPEHLACIGKRCNLGTVTHVNPWGDATLADEEGRERVVNLDGLYFGREEAAKAKQPAKSIQPPTTKQPRAAVNRPDLKGRASALSLAMVPLWNIKPVLQSRYLVKNWLDRGAFSVVYGESNVGKTFFALDLSMHVAAGKDWHGNRVPEGGAAGPVVYIAGEGGAGMNNRIEAIRRERPDLVEHEGDGDFVLLPVMIDLCGTDDAEAIIAAVEEFDAFPALIVIDTLAMAFGGGDENTARDMGIFVNNCRRIRNATGAHVMVIHHSGKDTSKGARGSNSLRGATDSEIELTADGKVIIAETRKQRDMEGGRTFAYTLRGVFIGNDEDGDKVTSAIVEPTDAPAKRAPRLKGQALIAMQAFGDALKEHGVSKTGEDFPHNRKCVSLDHWRDACARVQLSGGEGESSQRTAFHKQKGVLHEKGLIRIFDGFAWRCDE